MNIFASDKNPVKAAQNLDNVRVVKMSSETAQLLSTALFRLGYWSNILWKPAYQNHPCTNWTRASRGNFDWLVRHGTALCQEYTHRYYKIHAAASVILSAVEISKKAVFPTEPLQDFVNCTDVYTGTVVNRYRKYLIETKWKNDIRTPLWTNRGAPKWHKEWHNG